MANPIVTGAAKIATGIVEGAVETAPVAGRVVRDEGANLTSRAQRLLDATDTSGAGGRVVPRAAPAPGPGNALAVPNSVPPPAYQNELYSVGEFIGEARHANRAFMQGINNEAQLQSAFEPGAWRAVTDFMRTNENPGEIKKFLTDMLGNRARPTGLGSANPQGLIDGATVQAAIKNAPAAGVLADAAKTMAGIKRGEVGISGEISRLSQTFDRPGITMEQANQARDLAKVIANVADQHPGLARGIAEGAATAIQGDVNAIPKLLERARSLAQGAENRAPGLANTDAKQQLALAQRYMAASADDAARILDPAARPVVTPRPQTAPAPRTPGPNTGSDVPQSLNDALPDAARSRVQSLPQATREVIGQNDGWSTLEDIATKNPDVARAVVSELSRANVPATLHAASWLSQRVAATTDPVERAALLHDITPGSFYNEAIPNIVNRRLAAGATPQQALQELDSLMVGLPREARDLMARGLQGDIRIPAAVPRNPTVDARALATFRDARTVWWRTATSQ